MTDVLVLVHFQNDVIHPDGRISMGLTARPSVRLRVMHAAQRLIEGARDAGVPLIWLAMRFEPGGAEPVSNSQIFDMPRSLGALVEGSWGFAPLSGFEPREGEAVVAHQRISGFYGSTLADHVDRFGARRIVWCGVASNSSVEHSARDAVDRGYRILVAEDACGCARDDLHAAAMANLSLLGRVASVDEVLAEWSNA